MTPRQTALNLVFKLAAIAVWHRSPWLAAAIFTAPDFYLLYGMFVPASMILGPVLVRFIPSRPGAKEIWLTIDDGPDADDTPRILDALDRRGARATFFVIGARARQHPELIRQILERGHAIGHHSDSHPSATFWMATPAQTRREVNAGLATLKLAGVQTRAFRPPVGMRNLFLKTALRQAGLHCVNWSIRSGDCLTSDGGAVIARVVRQAVPGAIILMHEGPSVRAPLRVRVIEETVAALQQAGYDCVIPPTEALRGPAAAERDLPPSRFSA
jgi:peptidoglycan/xylan/chitin deacetylase (PgdA/CDA1 family)